MSDDSLAEKQISIEVAEVFGCCEIVVNNWVNRYSEEGIKGLVTRQGRRQPPLLSQQNPKHLKKIKDKISAQANPVLAAVQR